MQSADGLTLVFLCGFCLYLLPFSFSIFYSPQCEVAVHRSSVEFAVSFAREREFIRIIPFWQLEHPAFSFHGPLTIISLILHSLISISVFDVQSSPTKVDYEG